MKMTDRYSIPFCVLLIILVSFFAYHPVLSNAFTGGNERSLIGQNPLITEGWGKGWEIILSPSYYRDQGIPYAPLALLSFAVEYTFFEDNPAVFHGTGLVLHIATAVLVFFLVLMLDRRPRVSAAAALLFSLHPVNAEAVASLSARPELLMGFFYLLSLCFFILSSEKRLAFYSCLSLVSAALSMLSSPWGISIPLMMAGIGWYRTGKCEMPGRAILALSLGTLVMLSLTTSEYITGFPAFSFRYASIQNLYEGSSDLLTAISILAAPVSLMICYPYPGISPFSALLMPLCAGALVTLFLYGAQVWRRLALAGLLIIVPLLPHLHVRIERCLRDLDCCLPSIGMAFLIASAAAWLYHGGGWKKAAAVSAVIAVLLFYGVTAHTRCDLWADRESLAHAAHRLPVSEIQEIIGKEPLADEAADRKDWGAQGIEALEGGDGENAVLLLSKAITKDPENASLFYYRGLAFCMRGLREKACNDFDRALMISPCHALIFRARGAVNADMGRLDKALDDYEHYVLAFPLDGEALAERAVLLGRTGQYDRALADLEEARRLAPHSVGPLYDLAALHASRGEKAGGERYMKEIVALCGTVDPQRLSNLVALFREKR